MQLLLDAIVRYLPSPLDATITAKKHNNPTQTVPADPDPTKPLVGMAFKLVEESFGQLTFMRIYQGTLNKGELLLQPAHRPEAALQPDRQDARRQEGRHRFGRAGDIVAVMGIDCASGDTYCRRSANTARSRACSPPSR